MRTSNLFTILAIASLAIVSGCGGDTAATRSAAISGTVTGVDGNPVIGARVSVGGSQTITGPTGSYFLENIREDDQVVFAQLTQEGITYKGQNLARTFQGEVASSVNIAIAPTRNLAKLRGKVRDRQGRPLSGITVFAYGNALSSARALTNSQGDYQINDLISGVDYEILANGQGFRADRDTVFFEDGDVRVLDFQLSDAGFVDMPAPTNLGATTWVSPRPTRSNNHDAEAIKAIKLRWDPQYAQRKTTRSIATGTLVEVNLSWDPVTTNELLGYGIYRGQTSGSLESIDFWREPLTGYYVDIEPRLLENSTYFYEVRSLSAQYPDDRPDSISNPSNRATARTLNELIPAGVSSNPLRFNWNPGSGAAEFVVYVYDRLPGTGVSSIATNESNASTGSSWTYSGPALVPGRTYYYVILGLANDRTSRTLTGVQTFVATGP